MKNLSLTKIYWNNSISVGHAEIDEQHKKFLDIANKAIDAILERNRNSAAATIKELQDYARFHFKFESELMKKYNYTESGTHYDAHGDFYEKVAEIENSESNTKEDELVSFMQNWLILHIGSSDKKLADFINKKSK